MAIFYLGLLLIALSIGELVRRKVLAFAPSMNQMLYQQYQDYYAQYLDNKSLPLSTMWFKPLASSLYWIPLLLMIAMFVGLYLYGISWRMGWYFILTVIFLYIGVIDYFYRLISIYWCQALLLLILFGHSLALGSINLTQSVQSAGMVGAASLFFYWLTISLFKRVLLGEGDCWLLMAIAALLDWHNWIWLLCITSLLTIIVVYCYPKGRYFRAKEVPFAPAFLIVSSLIIHYT